MKRILLNLLLGCMALSLQAQNNDIFNGGDNDGWTSTGQLQPAVNIFSGGIADGWTFGSYQSSLQHIYNGGDGHGWQAAIYLQPGNAIFNGGVGDGWHFDTAISIDLNIYAGGAGDGWANTYKPMGSLPVTFLSFTANKKDGNAALLQWQTSQEINSSHFDLERSDDAVHFTFIGRVNAAGNSNQIMQYSFIDHNPMRGQNYYRIRQVDIDGRQTITPVRMLAFQSAAGSIKYFPNPTHGVLNVEIPADMQDEPKLINIVNVSGVMVNQLQLKGTGHLISLDFSRYPKGVYFVQFKNSRVNSTQRIVLQ
jgi:hypothetical protein